MWESTNSSASRHRCQKEIAPLLGVVPAAGEGKDEDTAKRTAESDSSYPSSSKPQDKDKQEKKRSKSRVKVFSAKEGVSSPSAHCGPMPEVYCWLFLTHLLHHTPRRRPPTSTPENLSVLVSTK